MMKKLLLTILLVPFAFLVTSCNNGNNGSSEPGPSEPGPSEPGPSEPGPSEPGTIIAPDSDGDADYLIWNGIYFSIDPSSDTAMITAMNIADNITKIILPRTVMGYNITSIGWNAHGINEDDFNIGTSVRTIDFSKMTYLTEINQGVFRDANIENVIFGNLPNLQFIRANAFINNNITSVNLTGLTQLTGIFGHAFRNNNIEEVYLSGLSSLVGINTHVFAENPLNNITLENLDSLSTIADNAFLSDEPMNVSQLTLVGLPVLLQTGIYETAFNGLTPADIFNAIMQECK